jgi:hypothetical protein
MTPTLPASMTLKEYLAWYEEIRAFLVLLLGAVYQFYYSGYVVCGAVWAGDRCVYAYQAR